MQHSEPSPSGDAIPRVCVLIRSIDRPSLRTAVESVQAQTFRDVGIVVAAAHGAPLTQLSTCSPGLPLSCLESTRPLLRSAAADLLLDHAQAEFALFLDDDDWLLPEHLARLVAALDADPGAVAAHAGVRCVAAGDDDREVHLFDDALAWDRMQFANQLPIHAVLFRTAAIRAEPALRFDRGLDHFEDWDFWLRLMARGRFVRVPGVSAVYRLDPDAGSGHTADARRHQRLARFGERLLRRWTADDVARLIEARAADTARQAHALQQLAAERDDARARHDAALAVQRAAAAALEAEQQRAAALEASQGRLQREADLLAAIRLEHLHQIELLHGRIAALYASTSWRLTRPLRLAGRTVAWLRDGGGPRLARNLGGALRTELRRKGWAGVLRRAPHYAAGAGRHLRRLGARPAVPADNPFAGPARPPAPLRLHPEIAGTEELLDTSVSVVIPALDGGDELVALVRKLLGQRAVRAVEVVVVDSGSRDGTPQRVRAAGARVVEIPPAAFSHSHARNVGADQASGEHLLFMVQDAYPIGDLWLYGMLRYLIDHREAGVVAASCAEYSRSDSDAMYDCMIQTHYRFLGCLDADRIGQHSGDDHMALRSMGQLSDVACLIPRTLFLQYRYRGDYAEDLDLGIRLIRAGHRIAMLASVKVIHSHNRPAWYYLKRSFVDVVFLVGLFDDFHCPPCTSVAGLLLGARQVAQRLAAALPRLAAGGDGGRLEDALGEVVAAARDGSAAGGCDAPLGDARLDAFVQRLLGRPPAAAATPGAPAADTAQARAFVDAFVARLDHFHQYAAAVYGGADARLRAEAADAVRKTYAATLGSALAFAWLDRRTAPADDAERVWLDALFAELKAGI